MTFTLEMECDNAAFEERAGETARILRELADQLDRYDSNSGKLRDVNGNTIGKWLFRG